jgi:DnaJ-class molecular chaperone
MQPDEARRLLAVDADASVEEIRAAYRRQARASHPDLGTADEHEARTAKMAAINCAVEVLLAHHGANTTVLRGAQMAHFEFDELMREFAQFMNVAKQFVPILCPHCGRQTTRVFPSVGRPYCMECGVEQ